MRVGAVTVSRAGSHHAKQNASFGAKFLRSSASLAARSRFQSAFGNACAVNLKYSVNIYGLAYDSKSIVTSFTTTEFRTQMVVEVDMVVWISSTDRALTGYYSVARWRFLFAQSLNSLGRSILLFPTRQSLLESARQSLRQRSR